MNDFYRNYFISLSHKETWANVNMHWLQGNIKSMQNV